MQLIGTTSSTGVAWGPVMVLESPARPSQDRCHSGDPRREVLCFQEAITHSRKELQRLQQDVRERIGEKEVGIFEAQEMILEDPLLVDEVISLIIEEGQAAEEALRNVLSSLEQQFLAIEDKTIRQRVADVKDVGARIIRWLNREESIQLENLESPVILVARDILPSQAASLDREVVRAIVTEKGGINSHASIIARSLDIPAVVGVANLLEMAGSARRLLVDGDRGTVIIDPDDETVRQYKSIARKRQQCAAPEPGEEISGVVKSADGEPVKIFANVGRMQELNRLKSYGVEGVGILRTEFLLMNRQAPPSVEDFVNHFRTILEFMDPRPVNIRLLDLGADKTFPYLTHPKEPNPALGERGVRFLLSNRHLLRDQIRGILEAATKGNPIIQIPMITTLQEVQQIKETVRSLEAEMETAGRKPKSPIPIGIMIETPAAAILSPQLAREVDSFSIGTNDLTQYVLASDRENEHVQELYNCLNPAVLHLIATTVRAAAKANIPVSVCGEMASDIRAIPILLGMGVRHLSVGVSRIPEVRDIVKKMRVKRAKRLANKALKTHDVIEVEKMVTRFLRKMERGE